MNRSLISLALVVALSCGAVTTASAAPSATETWHPAWLSAVTPFRNYGDKGFDRAYRDETVRQSLRLEASGTRLRVRFTNELGHDAVTIGKAAIARLDDKGAIVPGSVVPLSFGGVAGTTLPPGAPGYSDPVPFKAARFTDVAISVYYPQPTRPESHRGKVTIVAGDHAVDTTVAGATVEKWAPALASAVDVSPATHGRVLVAFGDSITEGAGSTPGAHLSWPEQLATRLDGWTVLNAGISGNRLLHDGRGGGGTNALSRFDRDVLSVPGVTDMVLLEGINDIGASRLPAYPDEKVSAAQIIEAYRQLALRAHAHGIRVFGGTLTPFQGAEYYDAAGEETRVAVNRWIRNSGTFDGVIDFDRVLRDPKRPARYVDAFQHGDNLHPSDAGYRAMAEAAMKALQGGR
jgi:lysophospholipase L1-like esterase